MKKFYNRVVNHPKIILLIFSILFIVCFIAKQFIAVNYDMNDYLPCYIVLGLQQKPDKSGL